jgi:hypothetical protein
VRGGPRTIGAAARRRSNAATALLVAASVSVAAAPLAPAALDAGANGAGTLDARVEASSRALLGAPYRLGPLGEGAPPDADPRFRLDAFDCTTYVETALALALAGADARDAADPDGAAQEAALEWLDRVRYRGGVPTFETRRHLIEAQWIPDLVEQGLVDDVTRAIGGRSTRIQVSRLRRERWERSRLATDLGLPWSALPPGRHALPYLPWSVLERQEVQRSLPAAGILNLIAAPRDDTPTMVTHQALLFRRDDGSLIVRHASTGHRRVVEEPLASFAARTRSRRSRTVLGVNVLAIAPDRSPAEPAP